jgi:hypothetical protein
MTKPELTQNDLIGCKWQNLNETELIILSLNLVLKGKMALKYFSSHQ